MAIWSQRDSFDETRTCRFRNPTTFLFWEVKARIRCPGSLPKVLVKGAGDRWRKRGTERIQGRVPAAGAAGPQISERRTLCRQE